eukprot:TRINITY_DN6812_c2_g2_i2.p1 TRINITY_DN6812_c2_g2~~TRINITY_DN6812_c2_g2_i2.p1  ORF type:complete len:229 (-),score=38.92 TRINITY_DN6812_c2_g2_i2:58-744(-)
MAEEPRGRPEIIYALIIRGPNVVLADHTRLTGNFQHATIQILSKLDRTQEELKSYIYGDYAFHYVIDQTLDLWFICMAERQLLRRIPFAFLSDMQDSFRRRYRLEQVEMALAYGMQSEFRPEMQALMEKYNSPDADRLTAMMAKVQTINDTLMDSIDKILERQEKIDLLVNRSNQLSQSSVSFRRDAQTLRRVYWWRNARTLSLIAGVIFIVVLITVLSSCGITFENC